MPKSIKKKSPKEASELFHNIMKVSVQGNPKPTSQAKTDSKKRKNRKS